MTPLRFAGDFATLTPPRPPGGHGGCPPDYGMRGTPPRPPVPQILHVPYPLIRSTSAPQADNFSSSRS